MFIQLGSERYISTEKSLSRFDSRKNKGLGQRKQVIYPAWVREIRRIKSVYPAWVREIKDKVLCQREREKI